MHPLNALNTNTYFYSRHLTVTVTWTCVLQVAMLCLCVILAVLPDDQACHLNTPCRDAQTDFSGKSDMCCRSVHGHALVTSIYDIHL